MAAWSLKAMLCSAAAMYPTRLGGDATPNSHCAAGDPPCSPSEDEAPASLPVMRSGSASSGVVAPIDTSRHTASISSVDSVPSRPARTILGRLEGEAARLDSSASEHSTTAGQGHVSRLAMCSSPPHSRMSSWLEALLMARLARQPAAMRASTSLVEDTISTRWGIAPICAIICLPSASSARFISTPAASARSPIHSAPRKRSSTTRSGMMLSERRRA
mmetsp:Transcript_41844/g.107068  ORF Transcript_41844/g.107068 Transcript_41844/m.107068 type:complete len:218 (-) Transcript_41844:1837-2490(-)